MALRDAARHVMLLTVAQWALLLLLGSGGLMPPEQTSLLPPSFCKAPPAFYQTVGILDFFFAPAAIGAVALAGFVATHHHVAAPGAGAGAATKALLRALTVTAVLLSATAAGIALTISVFVLQVKAGRLSCLSGSLRSSVYASCVVAGSILFLCYVDLARMALFSE